MRGQPAVWRWTPCRWHPDGSWWKWSADEPTSKRDQLESVIPTVPCTSPLWCQHKGWRLRPSHSRSPHSEGCQASNLQPNMHCKDKLPKFWNKYSQKRTIGVLVPISTFMRLLVIYILLRSVCLFCWRKYVEWSLDYINRSQTQECGNWGWGRAISRKGIHKWDFLCSVAVAEAEKVPHKEASTEAVAAAGVAVGALEANLEAKLAAGAAGRGPK